MYEPEKILVQNAGIDPGVAALLQNANKGNSVKIFQINQKHKQKFLQ